MCRISFSKDDSLADTVQQVSRQMQVYKTGNNILKSPLSWELAVRFTPYASLKRNFINSVSIPPVYFSNLGVLDRNLLCFGNSVIKDAYLAAAINAAPHLLLNASTFDNRCTLTCYFYGSERDQQWVITFLGHLAADIEALAYNTLKGDRHEIQG
jgi:NRPS condensation-like uncharacterized protein